MQSYLQAIIPVFLFISIGYIAKIKYFLDVDIARKLIKFLFSIPLPLLIFTNFATHPVDVKYFSLPVIAVLLSSSLMIVSYYLGKLIGLSSKRLGTIMVATGISSTLLYVLPLVASFYGVENTKYLFLYDFGNGLLAWTVVYYIAGYFGNKRSLSIATTFLTFLRNPMIWALIGGVLVGLLGITFPDVVRSTTTQLGGLTNPLLLMCVGVFLDFGFFSSKKHIVHLFLGTFLVMGLSYIISILLSDLFGLSGIVRNIVTMCAVAPAGSLTVAFSVEHDLDVEFASALVAMTMVIGVVLIPILAML